jgi:hypothetical protein
MKLRTRALITLMVALLTTLLAVGVATAREEDLAERLLRASEGLQMPGSEADSSWRFVSYPQEEELPTSELRRHIRLAGPRTTLDGPRPKKERPRVRQATQTLPPHKYGNTLAVYRCDTNMYGEVRIYFLGVNPDGLSGLTTTNIEA